MFCFPPAGCSPILILIHPRASHNTHKVFPTRQKGSDFLKDAEAVFDIVVWDDVVSEEAIINHVSSTGFLKNQ